MCHFLEGKDTLKGMFPGYIYSGFAVAAQSKSPQKGDAPFS